MAIRQSKYLNLFSINTECLIIIIIDINPDRAAWKSPNPVAVGASLPVMVRAVRRSSLVADIVSEMVLLFVY